LSCHRVDHRYSLWQRRAFAAEGKKSCSPLSEKLVRPRGESLRLKIGEIEMKILEMPWS